ncbi:MAG: hypothetical protein ABI844_02385 [Saprospiraceae bacterium]
MQWLVYLPEEILASFEIVSIVQKEEEIEIRLDELKTQIPKTISGSTRVVLDGYLNVLELQTFPAQGKAVYLKQLAEAA